MKKISISDFSFKFSGYGHYQVEYTSPTNQKTWSATTDNMQLIDATRNADNPTAKDLNALKKICKK